MLVLVEPTQSRLSTGSCPEPTDGSKHQDPPNPPTKTFLGLPGLLLTESCQPSSGRRLIALAWLSRKVSMAESVGAETGHWEIVLIVVERDGSLVLIAEPTRQAVPCPTCGERSRRQHSSYLRRPLDLPWSGHTVRLRAHSRRWFCDVPDCPREIFAERMEGVLAQYARRTCETTTF